MMPDPEKFRLNEAEHQDIFENDICPDLFLSSAPSVRPVAIIFGGQPGAGKSLAVDIAVQELGHCGGAVQIIGDDLRAYHPSYELLMLNDDKTAAYYTDRDTGLWVEKAIAEAKAQKFNLIIEGTMRDGDKVASTMQSLRGAGYQIDARVMAVNPRLSEQGILQRYERQKAVFGYGRMTTPEAHQAGLDGVLKTVERIESEKLADRITIYRRGPEELYSNRLEYRKWKLDPHGRAAIETERHRPMSVRERQDYVRGFEKLLVQLEQRKASEAEIKHMNALHERAVHELETGDTAKAVYDNPQMRVLSLLRADVIEAEHNGEELRCLVATAKLTRAEELIVQGERLTHHYKTIEMAGQQAIENWRSGAQKAPLSLSETELREASKTERQKSSKQISRKRSRDSDIEIS